MCALPASRSQISGASFRDPTVHFFLNSPSTTDPRSQLKVLPDDSSPSSPSPPIPSPCHPTWIPRTHQSSMIDPVCRWNVGSHPITSSWTSTTLWTFQGSGSSFPLRSTLHSPKTQSNQTGKSDPAFIPLPQPHTRRGNHLYPVYTQLRPIRHRSLTALLSATGLTLQ